jgi:dihydrofolate reductase
VTASVFIATSLDGFIARADGGLDWLPTGGEEDYGFYAFLESVDAVVMGRKTFDTVLGFGGAWPYRAKPVVVLSSRALDPPQIPGARLERMSGEPRAIADALDRRGLRRVYVDGGDTIRRFLDAGLVSRMTITTVPILLGGGIPLFGALARDVKLRHVDTVAYPSGLVRSSYEVGS